VAGLEHTADMAGALNCDGYRAIHPVAFDTINQVSPLSRKYRAGPRIIFADDAARTGGQGPQPWSAA
jgi:hypothetical protein